MKAAKTPALTTRSLQCQSSACRRIFSVPEGAVAPACPHCGHRYQPQRHGQIHGRRGA